MSEEVEREFNIKDVDPLLFYGINDRNLKIIEKHFPVILMGRGDRLIVTGERTAVDQVMELLSELIFIINKNKRLTRTDLLTIMQIVKGESTERMPVENADKELDSVVLFTESGYVRPTTEGQTRYINATKENDIVFCIGPAGTGKTYLAVALAISYLNRKIVNKIVLARPAVEAGESLGYLPGDFREKIDPYLRPLYDALSEMLPRERLRKLMEQQVIEVIPMAYMRGRTLNNAFVLLDEAQNCTFMQMKMFLTRLGFNSKSIINGDITQIDLPSKSNSGLLSIGEILEGIEGIQFINLTSDDVVRHQLVKKIIDAYASRNANQKTESTDNG